MISWMQKHRKYLVVTIWIASISFIGAGSVGWGAYSMMQGNSTVAEVGEIDVSVREFQREYSVLFGLYNQMMGGTLDENRAKQMGLHDQVMKHLLSRATLLNYAHELGIIALNEEVAEKIAKTPAFQKEGIFDRALYFELLEQNRMKASEYETLIQKEVILEKLNRAFKAHLTDLETEMAHAIFGIQDTLKIEILKLEDVSYLLDRKALQAYWEENKERYKTQKRYTLSMITTPVDGSAVLDSEAKAHYENAKSNFTDRDGKIQSYDDVKDSVIKTLAEKTAKTEALKAYLLLKKENTKTHQTVTLSEQNVSYGSEILMRLASAKVGDTLKPILFDKQYISVKVTGITPRATKTFDQAQPAVEQEFVSQKKRELLTQQAEQISKMFVGKKIGAVSQNETAPLEKDLTPKEAQVFLKQLFESKEPRGFVMFDDKAVVYEILEQRLLLDKHTTQNTERFHQQMLQLKQQLINGSLIETLQKRYQKETRVR
jgi:peptidyl-prolyl cis-trans isomerase D